MLYARIMTALILIPLVLWGILTFSPMAFAFAAAFLFILAANEWSSLCGISQLPGKVIYLIAMCLLMGLYYFCQQLFWLIFTGTALWILPIVWVLFYQPERFRYLHHSVFQAILGLILLSLGWYALVILREQPFGPLWLILLCILVWATDIFAFFSGRQWGERKLAPSISPGKTWAGFWGGLLGSLFLAFLVFAFLQREEFFSKPSFFSWQNLPLWLTIATLTTLLAVIGDLFESLMKRIAGIKDSGSLLPGHGGILDRIDSLIATLPLFCLFTLWIGR